MIKPLLAGAGGFIGSSARYLIGNAVTRFAAYPAFPLATTVVNIVGCLAIGILGGIAEIRDIFSESVRVFLFIGILGGFTTFSTFGYESFQLARQDRYGLALANIAIQLIAGLAAVWTGFKIVKAI
ncbi:MAG: fluoride efflux transporter CrcB [Acidobacteria bacterium]|nr:MAG: fluoride efflux transporter CrcB [Acidobacteriota bacterium]